MTDRLSEIEGRLRAATPGPWWTPSYIAPAEVFAGTGLADDTCVAEGMYKHDAEFIANAPTDIAALLGAVKEVRELANYLDTLAPGDQHYAKLIRAAIGKHVEGKK
jgi:hypothetical protein